MRRVIFNHGSTMKLRSCQCELAPRFSKFLCRSLAVSLSQGQIAPQYTKTTDSYKFAKFETGHHVHCTSTAFLAHVRQTNKPLGGMLSSKVKHKHLSHGSQDFQLKIAIHQIDFPWAERSKRVIHNSS